MLQSSYHHQPQRIWASSDRFPRRNPCLQSFSVFQRQKQAKLSPTFSSFRFFLSFLGGRGRWEGTGDKRGWLTVDKKLEWREAISYILSKIAFVCLTACFHSSRFLFSFLFAIVFLCISFLFLFL